MKTIKKAFFDILVYMLHPKWFGVPPIKKTVFINGDIGTGFD